MFHHMYVVQRQVINHIMQNGGSDPNGSGFIFHFREFGDVMDCRDSMSIAVPAAFHFSIEVTNRFNAPPEVPVASVWIIIKTAVLSTDYREDQRFLPVWKPSYYLSLSWTCAINVGLHSLNVSNHYT